MATPVSRRGFLQASAATAGSLVVGFHIPFAGVASAQPGDRRPRSTRGSWCVPTTPS